MISWTVLNLSLTSLTTTLRRSKMFASMALKQAWITSAMLWSSPAVSVDVVVAVAVTEPFRWVFRHKSSGKHSTHFKTCSMLFAARYTCGSFHCSEPDKSTRCIRYDLKLYYKQLLDRRLAFTTWFSLVLGFLTFSCFVLLSPTFFTAWMSRWKISLEYVVPFSVITCAINTVLW